jgi:hypothetical protein
METKNAFGAGFLIVACLLTAWMWGFIEQFWGVLSDVQDSTTTVHLLRWLALLIGFSLLLLGGRLNGWVRGESAQFLVMIGAVTLMEVGMVKMEFWLYRVNAGHFSFVGREPSSQLRLIAAAALIAIPLCVIVGGWLGSRILLAAGLAGALLAWCGPFAEPAPASAAASMFEGKSVESMVGRVTPYSKIMTFDAVIAHLEKHPGWVQTLSRMLDSKEYPATISVAYTMLLKPEALGEEEREKCWQAVMAGTRAARVYGEREKAMDPTFPLILEVTERLEKLPGAALDRHREDLAEVRTVATEWKR